MHLFLGMTSSSAIPSELMTQVMQTCLCRRVQRASRSVGRRFDDALRGIGLNNWQFTLLMVLSGPTALTINEIAAELGMDRTTTSRNLGPLERRGLIEVSPDEQDARVRRVILTGEGRRLLDEAVGRWQPVNDAISAGLTQEQLSTLRQALDAISQN
jgi:DNA-binding MarR family transcriptional regulator